MCRPLTQLRAILPFGVFAFLLTNATCSSPPLPPSAEEREAADAILEILSTTQTSDISDAFSKALEWPHIRHDRTEGRGEHSYNSLTNLVRVDSSGASVIVAGSDSTDSGDLSALVDDIIPDEAAYLLDRFKDEFLYRIQEDAHYWSQPAHVVTITARPGANQTVQYASYVFDDSSEKLVSLSFRNHTQTILFEETSQYQLQLRPGPDGTWVPYRLVTRVALQLPSRQQRLFARNVTFYGYITRPEG
jgi:hypothetical protein